MAITATNHAPHGAASNLHVVGAFTNVFNIAADWYAARKTRALLNELTDAQLDDIGLTRAEISKI